MRHGSLGMHSISVLLAPALTSCVVMTYSALGGMRSPRSRKNRRLYCFQRPRRLLRQRKAYYDGKLCAVFWKMNQSDDPNDSNIPTPVTSASYNTVLLGPTIVNGELHEVCVGFMSDKYVGPGNGDVQDTSLREGGHQYSFLSKVSVRFCHVLVIIHVLRAIARACGARKVIDAS